MQDHTCGHKHPRCIFVENLLSPDTTGKILKIFENRK